MDVAEPVAQRGGGVVHARAAQSAALGQALYEKDKIGTAGRGMGDRGGLRASPHFYNTPEEIDRLVSAVARLPEVRRLTPACRFTETGFKDQKYFDRNAF